MHAVQPGAADRSYGIHVARIAGLPKNAVARAQQVLELLNKGEQSGALARLTDDLPLFQPLRPEPQKQENPISLRLQQIIPDELTPREALDLLYELKGLAKQ